MRKLTSLILLLILLSSGSALALTINNQTTQVGVLDKFVTSATLANSGTAEQDWINNIFGDDYYVKYDVTAANWTQVDNRPTYYALELQSEPTHFFIKLGTGGSDIPATHYLYENLDELMYAVVDIAAWGDIKVNIGRVSHVGEIGGTTSVPEPATMLLLGVGLVGLAGYSRRKFRNI